MAADLAVWSHDLLTTDPDRLLAEGRCLATMLAGEVVFGALEEAMPGREPGQARP